MSFDLLSLSLSLFSNSLFTHIRGVSSSRCSNAVPSALSSPLNAWTTVEEDSALHESNGWCATFLFCEAPMRAALLPWFCGRMRRQQTVGETSNGGVEALRGGGWELGSAQLWQQ